MKRVILFLIMCLSVESILAQDIDYRSKANPHYWQSRKPHAAYWQQDVHYKISAKLDIKTRVIEAKETLTYYNNSPYSLDILYFHLYQNAFTKGSYLADLHKANGQEVTNMGKYQAAGLGTVVDNLKVNGQKVKVELDNTILKVYLNKPIKSGESADLTMDFATFFDSQGFRRRMAVSNAWGFPHFNGVHWYPRICVFDAKKGWDLDQHLNKELYGDYGRFDVELTLPNNYVTEATGQLMNPQEVFPGDLRERLDIKNFKNAKSSDKPSIIIPYDSTKFKTWKYTAINVHDFAFTTDPSYRLGEAEWNGVKCVVIVQEPHCGGWQTSADYMTRIIKTFSEDFGMYEYPKIVAADANDGMEYPMITMDGGMDPDNRGLLVHEIGHNWFYGMIGNNETYRASLDEGFTQFLTSWGLEKLDGRYIPGTAPKNKYLAKYKKPVETRERSVFYRYINDVVRATDVPLNTHSDDFNGALGHENGYGLVYYKTATMLYNLQAVLGDELFLKSIQHYVEQWKFCHPYFEDFRASIINFTHQDLNWFFDQFLETTKYVDYGITKVKRVNDADKYEIKLERKGQMQMPLDIRVVSKKKEVYNFYIPNQSFRKETKATQLPKWFGWGILRPTYSFQTTIPGGIKSVEIDPSHRLPDMDPTDNSKMPGHLFSSLGYKLERDRCISQFPNRNQYIALWRPDMWWNPIDGTKVGFHLEGDYIGFAKNIDATVWLNTHLPQYNQFRSPIGEGLFKRYKLIDYTIHYSNPIRSTQNKISWGIGSRMIEGFAKHSAQVDYNPTSKNNVSLSFNALYRYGNYNRDYLFFPNEWSSDISQNGPQSQINSFLQAQWTHNYNYKKGYGRYGFTMRLPVPNTVKGQNYNYSYLQFESVNKNYWKKFDINTRLLARYGIGDYIPTESALYLQGANPEDLMENKYARSQGIIPVSAGGFSTTGFANMHMGGGLNLRGYNGYYAVDVNDAGDLFINYKGLSGAGANIEVEFDRFINWKPKKLRNYLHFDSYLFADGGVMSRATLDIDQINNLAPVHQWSKLRMDAGVGVAMTVKRWGIWDKLEPLTIRFDAPLFLSSPPFGQEYLDFRWVIGVNRAF